MSQSSFFIRLRFLLSLVSLIVPFALNPRLMCDEDNQYDLSEERAKKWVAQLKEEGFM